MQSHNLNKPDRLLTKIFLLIVLVAFCGLGAHSFATKATPPDKQELKHTGFRTAPDNSFKYKIWHEADEICIKFISKSQTNLDIVSVVSFVRIGVYSYGKSISLHPDQTKTVRFDMVGGNVKPDFYKIEIFKSDKNHHYLELQRVFLLNREPL